MVHTKALKFKLRPRLEPQRWWLRGKTGMPPFTPSAVPYKREADVGHSVDVPLFTMADKVRNFVSRNGIFAFTHHQELDRLLAVVSLPKL